MADVNEHELDRILASIDSKVYGGNEDHGFSTDSPAGEKSPTKTSTNQASNHPMVDAERPKAKDTHSAPTTSTENTPLVVPSVEEDNAPEFPSDGWGNTTIVNESDSQLELGDSMANHFASQEPEAPKKGSHKKVGITLGVIAAGLAAVYVGGSIYFGSHFLPNTKIGSYDASNLSVDELAQQVTSAGQNYQAQVTGDGLSLTINGSDIDYSSDGTTFAQSAKSQYNEWAWPALIFQAHNYDASEGISYDSTKLDQIVSDAVDAFNQTATEPVNASLKYDADSQQFSIEDAVAGTALNKDATTQAINEGVSNANANIALDDSDLNQPAVTADNENLQQSLAKANQLVSSDLTLTYNGSTIATVPASQFATWLTINDDGNVSGDFETIKTWAQGDFSSQYDTVGTTRTYTRPDGKEVTVSGGNYGWNIDGESLANNIVAAIEQNTTTVEVPMKSTAVNWVQGGQDWGTRYIDADLSEQHARMYDESGNLIWESDFVSGDTSEGHGTPEGVYTVNENKGTNQTLIGLDYNHDGEPDYRSNVSYWIPFEENLVAFHDASWRSRFGGSIYIGNGSHGCLNLPTSAARTLYDLTQIGDVVVVHS